MLLLLLPQVLSQNSFPPTITLQGLVRDFSSYHVDFESPVNWCKAQTNIFQQYLTSDKKPIMVPPQLRTTNSMGIVVGDGSSCPYVGGRNATTAYAVSNFGQFYHDEYYQDVPGVNIAIPIEITLNYIPNSNGLYQYTSSSFFPINSNGYLRELLDSNSPLNNQLNRISNYWFTTEFEVSFYYRGGEVFSFTGDDDLWVFIDNKLTSCDLGSIHIALSCSISLDSLGLTVNTLHSLHIFHAERHYSGSNFRLTTSIIPQNRPPITSDSTVQVNENTPVLFTPNGYDPDQNSVLSFMLLTAPQNGVLNYQLNTWINDLTQIQYTPNNGFFGNDEVTFVMNDGQLNSTVSYIFFAVNKMNQAPVAINNEITVTVGSNVSSQLKATDGDTMSSDLRYYLYSTPNNGYASISPQGVLNYHGMKEGVDVIEWKVYDGTTLSTGTTTITIESQKPSTIFTLAPIQVAGIIIGGTFFFSLIGIMLAYFLYYQVAYNKFEKIWEKEFRDSKLLQNPLYQPVSTEVYNPLYMGSQESVSIQV